MTTDDTLFAPLEAALKPVYQLIRRLGEGGMGAVYMAREPALKRDVAVKVMLPWLAQDATARARFDREAQAVAAIAHPNVINIYGTGELKDGTPYFVMQFVAGRGLEERIAKDGALGLREARRVLAEVAAALEAAHARGIIHRDIKAANVLQDAESGRVIVTDFGIAAVRTSADMATAKLTSPDTGSPGTPFYMAPEQLLGEDSTEASDVYAFGLLAYELLTGAGPFNATSPHEVAAAHLRDVPAPLSQVRDDVDADLEHLVTACLAKTPAGRPAASELVRRLPPADVFALEWPPPGLDTVAGRLSRVNRTIGAGTALATAGVLGMVLTDPSGDAPFPLWLLETCAVLGAIVLARGVSLGTTLLRGMRRASRQGYASLPVLEVAADRRGDTGALITGVRDYAPLARATRSRLRAFRLAAAACGFAAAVLPLPLVLLVVRLAASGDLHPAAAFALVALPSLLLLLAAVVLSTLEDRMIPVRRTRRTRRRTAEVGARVVKAWNDSFESARAGQDLGARMPPPFVTRLSLRVVLAVLGLGVLALIPVALMPVFGWLWAASAIPKFGSTRMRTMPAVASRPWAPAANPAVGPDSAGRLLHALISVGQTVPAGLRPPVPAYAAGFLPPDNPFGDRGPQFQDSLLRLGAARAFTPAQTAWLARVAAHPGWAAVHTVATAARADVAGARYTPETLASATWSGMAIPRYAGFRDVSGAASAVAALRLSQGRPAEAEAVLRDVVGAGYALMRDGVFLIETMVGATLVNPAMERLATVYELTGRPADAAAIRAARDDARARAERASAIEDATVARYRDNPTGHLRSTLKAMLTDTAMPASFRWEWAGQVAHLSCFNARELVFGPMPDIDSALTLFARQTVRTAGDSAWLRMTQRPPLAVTPLMASIGAGYGRLLGNGHVGRCMQLMLSIF